jgi:hypothetical protein
MPATAETSTAAVPTQTAAITKAEASGLAGCGWPRVLLRVYAAPMQKPLTGGRVGDKALLSDAGPASPPFRAEQVRQRVHRDARRDMKGGPASVGSAKWAAAVLLSQKGTIRPERRSCRIAACVCTESENAGARVWSQAAG